MKIIALIMVLFALALIIKGGQREKLKSNRLVMMVFRAYYHRKKNVYIITSNSCPHLMNAVI